MVLVNPNSCWSFVVEYKLETHMSLMIVQSLFLIENHDYCLVFEQFLITFFAISWIYILRVNKKKLIFKANWFVQE